MALEHAILVSLAEKSGSGYELARRFDKSIGFFWHASHQQIYRVLKRMEAQHWINRAEITQTGRPDKNVYRVTANGRAEIRRWIAEPSEAVQFRSELGVKIRAAAHGDLTALRGEIKRHLDEHEARLDLYRRIEKRDFPAPAGLTGTSLHQYLVLRGGIRAEEAFSQWCQEVLAALD